jgi:hypothetical protein
MLHGLSDRNDSDRLAANGVSQKQKPGIHLPHRRPAFFAVVDARIKPVDPADEEDFRSMREVDAMFPEIRRGFRFVPVEGLLHMTHSMRLEVSLQM